MAFQSLLFCAKGKIRQQFHQEQMNIQYFHSCDGNYADFYNQLYFKTS